MINCVVTGFQLIIVQINIYLQGSTSGKSLLWQIIDREDKKNTPNISTKR